MKKVVENKADSNLLPKDVPRTAQLYLKHADTYLAAIYCHKVAESSIAAIDNQETRGAPAML